MSTDTLQVDTLERFRQAARDNRRNSFPGALLTYKRSRWVCSDEDRSELPDGTELVALMPLASHGWVRWQDGNPTEHVVGRIGEGFIVPPRSTLGDQDAKQWPFSAASGKQEDPWKKTVYLPLQSLDDEELIFTFTSITDGGAQAFYWIVDQYGELGRKYPGQNPIISLGTESYAHKRFGTIHKPKLEICGWTGQPAARLAHEAEPDDPEDEQAKPLRYQVDDDIPF